jgi:hypothetical protein
MKQKFRQIKNRDQLRKKLWDAVNNLWDVSCDVYYYEDSHSPFTVDELDNIIDEIKDGLYK